MAICLVAVIKAQDYNTGVGLRLGYYNGLTVKHFISPKSAVEGLLIFRWAGVAVTGLYEVHNQAFDVERLKWYFGGGAHVGFFGIGYGGGSGTFVGIDGIIGIEYKFEEVPINLGLDWKPAFDFGYSHFFGDGAALSVRYVF